jgi:hypothetical protein
MWKGILRWLVVVGVVPAGPLPFRSVPFVVGVDTFVVGGKRGMGLGGGTARKVR